MPRRNRIVIPGVPFHVTQRGNDKMAVFRSDDDRQHYLGLMHHYSVLEKLQILAYALMTNHVHFVVVPETMESLSRTFHVVHSLYAHAFNAKYARCGHLWQQRYFSAPLDREYMWNAIGYGELNAVRAGLVIRPENYAWSSAKAHVLKSGDPLLTRDPRWVEILERPNWKEWLDRQGASDEILRRATARNVPCGEDDFFRALEEETHVSIRVKKRGRPAKVSAEDSVQ